MRNFLLLAFFILMAKVSSQQSAAVVGNYDFPKIKSSVTMPVKIPLAEIANVINANVPQLIFSDDSYTDNNNDQFKVKVWKTRPVRLVGGTKQNLLIEVPLKIWAEKGIGTLGMYTYQDTTFEAVLYFNSQLTLNSNWTVTTKTSPMGFKWVTKPVLDFGKIQVPISGLIESSLAKQQSDFCNTIDAMMLKQLNFQPYALMAWNQFSEPFSISDQFSTWLKISPQKINISPLVFYGNQIEVNIGVDTYSETFTGAKPASSPVVKTVPDFSSVAVLPQRFLLQTTANVPYAEATKIAENMFLNKSFDFRGGSKIKVSGIKVYDEKERLMIEVKCEDAVQGTAFISGIPVYDGSKRSIVLTDTKFRLKTKNILHKTATLLFQGKIVRMIEGEYGIPMAALEDSSRISIEQNLSKTYYKGLKMQGKVFDLKPSNILLGSGGITAVIDTEAQLKLLVQGLQF